MSAQSDGRAAQSGFGRSTRSPVGCDQSTAAPVVSTVEALDRQAAVEGAVGGEQVRRDDEDILAAAGGKVAHVALDRGSSDPDGLVVAQAMQEKHDVKRSLHSWIGQDNFCLGLLL